MVQSIMCDPKICAKSELMSLSTKKPSEQKKKSIEKIPQLDGGDDKISAVNRKSNRKKNQDDIKKDENTPINEINIRENEPGTSKKSFTIQKNENCLKNLFSPRKTRSMRKEHLPNSKMAEQTSNKVENNEKLVGNSVAINSTEHSSNDKQSKGKNDLQKNTLKVFSPRRLRSRSRSAEQSVAQISKPNLKNLSKKREFSEKRETETKKMRVEEKSMHNNKKRGASNDDGPKNNKSQRIHNNEFDSDAESLKYFKTTKTTSKKTNKNCLQSSSSKIIDRRILSSDDEKDDGKKIENTRGINIWVEVYSEKEEKWIAIDVYNNKIDCVNFICKKATHPIVYVFAWNNDNSIKDISARYCTNLNTAIRKMRVDRDYLHSILEPFVGVRSTRDMKEDDELNKLQLEKPLPTSIAE
jgi:xeroderma pigmentosum group C-complementing protein